MMTERQRQVANAKRLGLPLIAWAVHCPAPVGESPIIIEAATESGAVRVFNAERLNMSIWYIVNTTALNQEV